MLISKMFCDLYHYLTTPPYFTTSAHCPFVVVIFILNVILWPTYYLLMGIVVAPHFDQYFPNFVNDKTAIENRMWIFSPCGRGFRYVGLMLFKNATKKSVIKGYIKYYFGNFDFRAHARPADWAVFYLFMITHGISALVFCAYSIIDHKSVWGF